MSEAHTTETHGDSHTNGHANGHNGHGHHGPPPPRTGFAPLDRAGLAPRPVDDAVHRLPRPRHHVRDPLGRRLAAHLVRAAARHRRDDLVPARLPRRSRRLRLLDLLRVRSADEARGPLGPRRLQLARLLPPEHRPQGDRRAVPGHDDVLLRRRRPHGDDVPRRAGRAGDAVLQPADVQRPDLEPRGADDLPRRRARVRRASATSSSP